MGTSKRRKQIENVRSFMKYVFKCFSHGLMGMLIYLDPFLEKWGKKTYDS